MLSHNCYEEMIKSDMKKCPICREDIEGDDDANQFSDDEIIQPDIEIPPELQEIEYNLDDSIKDLKYSMSRDEYINLLQDQAVQLQSMLYHNKPHRLNPVRSEFVEIPLPRYDPPPPKRHHSPPPPPKYESPPPQRKERPRQHLPMPEVLQHPPPPIPNRNHNSNNHVLGRGDHPLANKVDQEELERLKKKNKELEIIMKKMNETFALMSDEKVDLEKKVFSLQQQRDDYIQKFNSKNEEVRKLTAENLSLKEKLKFYEG